MRADTRTISIEAPVDRVVAFLADPRNLPRWAAPGIEVLAASRVVPRGTASEYVFTQFQAPGIPDDVFVKNVRALTHELTVLRALMEVECPL